MSEQEQIQELREELATAKHAFAEAMELSDKVETVLKDRRATMERIGREAKDREDYAGALRLQSMIQGVDHALWVIQYERRFLQTKLDILN